MKSFSFFCLIFCAFWGVKAQSNMHYVGTCGSNYANLYVSYPSGTTYSWNTGDNTSYITAQNPGIYWVQSTISGGSTTIDSFTIVNSSPFTVAYTMPACGNMGDTLQLMATPIGGTAPFTAQIQFGQPPMIPIANPLTDSFAFPMTANFNYAFFGMLDSLGCYSYDTIWVPICGIHADAGPDITCNNTYIGGYSVGQYFPLHYSWSPNTGMLSGQDTLQHPYITLPTTTSIPYIDYILTVTDTAGNVDTDTMRVVILNFSTNPLNDTVCYSSGVGTAYLNINGISPYYHINWGDGQNIVTYTNIVQHDYFLPNPYNVVVSAGNCSVTKPILVKLCGAISTAIGRVYVDMDVNGLYNAGDIPIANHIVHVSSFGFAVTDANGIYTIDLDTLTNYTLTANNLWQTAMPNSYAVYFPNSGMTATGKDFYFQPVQDLGVYHSAGTFFIANQTITIPIYYRYYGANPINATLRFIKDTDLNFLSSTPPYNTISGDTITWNFPNLTFTQNGQINLLVQTSSTTTNTTIIHNESDIFPIANDINPNNNHYISGYPFLYCYDPNAKYVSQTEILQQNLATMQPLDYVVQFQNTGTAPAMNVIIKDTLSDFLDLTTFELRETSHPCQLKVIDNHILEWKFANIMLPDSNSNEPASHGFLHYTIKPFVNLQINDEIFNSASIYFDFNAPIQTNTVSTKIIAPIAIEKAGFATLSLAPNPVNKWLHLQISNTQAGLPLHLQILNLQGQIIEEKDLKMDKSYLDYEIATEKWAQGLYFVVISSEKGYLKGTFVKE